jgi:hypothetical protein
VSISDKLNLFLGTLLIVAGAWFLTKAASLVPPWRMQVAAACYILAGAGFLSNGLLSPNRIPELLLALLILVGAVAMPTRRKEAPGGSQQAG